MWNLQLLGVIAMKLLKGIWILLILLFLPKVYSQGVAIGINNYLLKIPIQVNSYNVAYIGIVNPSPYDLKVRVYFDCDTCVSDFKIFGVKIGESIEIPSQYFTLEKTDVFIPNNTRGVGIPVAIHLHPRLILMKKLRIYTPESINFLVKLINPKYQGKIEIPYLTLLIGNREIKGRIVVDAYWSSFGAMGVSPAIASVFELYVKGMPLGSFLIIITIFFAILILILYKCRRKLSKFKIKRLRRRKKTSK